MPKVSVILPVYGVAQYIEKGIESLLSRETPPIRYGRTMHCGRQKAATESVADCIAVVSRRKRDFCGTTHRRLTDNYAPLLCSPGTRVIPSAAQRSEEISTR